MSITQKQQDLDLINKEIRAQSEKLVDLQKKTAAETGKKERDLAALQRTIVENRKQWDESISQYNEKVEKLQNKMDILNNSIKDCLDKKEKEQGRLAVLQTENEYLTQENADLKQQESKLVSSVASLKEEEKQKRIAITTAQQELSGLQEEISYAITKKDEAETQMKETQGELKKVISELENKIKERIAISKWQGHVKQNEAYIKDQFERAGIKYQEYKPN